MNSINLKRIINIQNLFLKTKGYNPFLEKHLFQILKICWSKIIPHIKSQSTGWFLNDREYICYTAHIRTNALDRWPLLKTEIS